MPRSIMEPASHMQTSTGVIGDKLAVFRGSQMAQRATTSLGKSSLAALRQSGEGNIACQHNQTFMALSFDCPVFVSEICTQK